MLFDLRGRGRRRTVQGIYLGLAVLMGGGLVLFGIGGATNGGLLNAVTGSNGATSSNLAGTVKAAQKRAALAPRSAPPWARLAQLEFQLAGLGENYDQTQGTFTAKGRAVLLQAKQAWEHYLALNPRRPDADVANEMVQAFGGSGGLSDYAAAARAAEIVAAARPGAAIYAELSAYAYLAGETHKGDLAAAKAVSLAPPSRRAALRAQLKLAKAQAHSRSTAGATGPGSTTGTPSGR